MLVCAEWSTVVGCGLLVDVCGAEWSTVVGGGLLVDVCGAEWSTVVGGGLLVDVCGTEWSTVVGCGLLVDVYGTEWSILAVCGAVVADGGPPVVGCSATLEEYSDHNWWPSLARNLFTFPQVRHFTTRCLSRRAAAESGDL